jgi:hypothetical protein
MILPEDILDRCFEQGGTEGFATRTYREIASDAQCPTRLLPYLASRLDGAGDYAAALDVCREIVRRDAEHHEAQFGVAYYHRRLGGSTHAVLPAVVRAHELAPDVPLYRISLAVLLDSIGWREDAYDLLRDLDPCSVSCRYCLQKAMAIFRESGDCARSESFRVRAEQVSDFDAAE